MNARSKYTQSIFSPLIYVMSSVYAFTHTKCVHSWSSIQSAIFLKPILMNFILFLFLPSFLPSFTLTLPSWQYKTCPPAGRRQLLPTTTTMTIHIGLYHCDKETRMNENHAISNFHMQQAVASEPCNDLLTSP